ncbi:hypothetical protein LI036_09980 [bacterium 210917-DFI.7.65]|nr:hypothetical protein [bacterium 210917-DFI.7.65]
MDFFALQWSIVSLRKAESQLSALRSGRTAARRAVAKKRAACIGSRPLCRRDRLT